MKKTSARPIKDDRIHLAVDGDLKQRVERAAAHQPEFSLSAWIREAMREKLEREAA